jgi:hypothetical protein
MSTHDARAKSRKTTAATGGTEPAAPADEAAVEDPPPAGADGTARVAGACGAGTRCTAGAVCSGREVAAGVTGVSAT